MLTLYFPVLARSGPCSSYSLISNCGRGFPVALHDTVTLMELLLITLVRISSNTGRCTTIASVSDSTTSEPIDALKIDGKNIYDRTSTTPIASVGQDWTN